MNLFLPRKRHLVTAVPAVIYAVNYPIIIQVISEIQEKSCAFVEMVKIVCCPSFFTRRFLHTPLTNSSVLSFLGNVQFSKFNARVLLAWSSRFREIISESPLHLKLFFLHSHYTGLYILYGIWNLKIFLWHTYFSI